MTSCSTEISSSFFFSSAGGSSLTGSGAGGALYDGVQYTSLMHEKVPQIGTYFSKLAHEVGAWAAVDDERLDASVGTGA